MSIRIPGDFVKSFNESDAPFLQKHESFTSTKVVGTENDGQPFKILRKAVVPQIHDTVIARVIRTKRKEAHLLILMTNNVPLISPLLAELRSVDIAEKDVDNQVASQFCHPGDLIKAKVVALGRSGFYAQLSTAEEGLGVVKLTTN